MSNVQYARYIGIKMGGGNFIADKDHWPSEAYLITVGSNCAITAGVKIFTHGGPAPRVRADKLVRPFESEGQTARTH